jgi:hypothetical protein
MMATNTEEELTVHQDASTDIEIPAEIKEKAQQFIDNYVAYLKERTQAYVHRMAEAKPEAGEPVLAGGYQYWNCLTVGPIQFYTDPPYRPSKIIAAGELTLMLGVVWINPANSPGGGLPGTIVLGGRTCRMSFETINLSDIANGPEKHRTINFDNPAEVINRFRWRFRPADPGANPSLYETTLTADIVETGQPMAAFSTWHLDLDLEPGFLRRPTVARQWQYDIPARFLVYRK